MIVDVTALHRAALTGIALLLAVADARGQQFMPTGRGTLRGLPGVEVVVEGLEPELEAGGLTGASLKSEIEGRLRARGISVYASQADNPSPAKPYLYLDLNPLTLQHGELAIAVQLHVRQTVQSPATQSHIVNAITWDLLSVIAVKPGDIAETRAAVQALVEQFIEDWVSVHDSPKTDPQ
jgi:hypothetical protein